jgi:hypothetical protein
VRFVTLVFVLFIFAGCATTRPIQPTASSADLIQLATEYRAALSRDEELSRLYSNFSISDSGAMLGTLELNKKSWGDLSRAQRDRVIKRATDLYARQFAISPAGILGVSSVTIKDDTGSTRGWIVVCTCGVAQYSLYGS